MGYLWPRDCVIEQIGDVMFVRNGIPSLQVPVALWHLVEARNALGAPETYYSERNDRYVNVPMRVEILGGRGSICRMWPDWVEVVLDGQKKSRSFKGKSVRGMQPLGNQNVPPNAFRWWEDQKAEHAKSNAEPEPQIVKKSVTKNVALLKSELNGANR